MITMMMTMMKVWFFYFFFYQLFLFFTFVTFLPSYSSFSTLLLGDSVDRFMMEDWCHTQKFPVQPWGDFTPNISLGKIIKYGHQYKIMFKGRWNHPFICYDPMMNDSLASVHIFGSGNHGPYLYNISNNPLTDLVETPKRLNLTLNWYVEKFGYPNRIIFHTGQWDKQRFYEKYKCDGILPNLTTWDDSLHTYYRNTNARLDQIIQLVGNHSDIGLRTAVWQKDKCEIGFLDEINSITRKVAYERKLTLYDYDKDVWSVVNYDRSNISYIFRDWMHPTRFVSFSAAEKVLGRRYSQHLFIKTIPSLHYANDLSEYEDIEISILKIQDKQRYYFTKLKEKKGYHRYVWKISLEGARSLHIGPGDILTIPKSAFHSLISPKPSQSSSLAILQSISHIPDVYTRLNGQQSQTFGMITTSDEKYILDGTRHSYNISSLSSNIFASMGFSLSRSNLYQNLSYFWIERHTHMIMEIPNLFEERSLLRCTDSKQIYLIENYTRHSINSLVTFTARGFELDKVIPIQVRWCRFLYLINETSSVE